jgi:putative sugar O-methyltransferase
MEKITSTSEENYGYLDISSKASADDKIFETFKSNENYNGILEHVTQYEGNQYLDIIYNPIILENIQKFKINDILGGPRKYNYDKIGETSPTTLRYIKVLQDLMDNFDLENSNIIEIGCGYGGQYVILKQLFNPKKYSFVDLPIILPLIEKYLIKLDLVDDTSFINFKNAKYDNNYDLVISNYAISECDTETQLEYLEKVLKNSKHGYITHNQYNGYTLDEFVGKLKFFGKNPVVMTEKPLTAPQNVIIIW